MATIIKSNGERVEIVGHGKKNKLTLEQMQGAVGGYIELVIPRDAALKGKKMWVNCDGKLRNLPVNTTATQLAQIGDFIVGDVLITDKGEVD